VKVLFDHPSPFMLAHGGFQTQIEQTRFALLENGVEVDWLRWWDCAQGADIIHYFGRPGTAYIEFAHQKGMKVVMSELLTGLGSRSSTKRAIQKLLMDVSKRTLPKMFTGRMAWDSYQVADACIALTSWEADLMRSMFDAPPDRVHVVPNGVELEFFQSSPVPRGQWLVCTATVTERKRVLELAQAALAAETPVWIIGKPYSESAPYFRQFMALAENSGDLVRFEGAINDRTQMAAVYRQARGFVLLSSMESLSLSALEAAACECPLLLSDLPWARATFAGAAEYCPADVSASESAKVLKDFYARAPQLAAPPKPATWNEIGQQLKAVYSKLL
jgi:glycosyltransferase involved in cell wall biosynthesis